MCACCCNSNEDGCNESKENDIYRILPDYELKKIQKECERTLKRLNVEDAVFYVEKTLTQLN